MPARHTILLALIPLLAACAPNPRGQQRPTEYLSTTPFAQGRPMRIAFEPGSHYYHPLIAFWLEDTSGHYIQTLYVTQSIATGVFRFGQHHRGQWAPGPRRRPAALPYWGHRRGFQAPDGLFLPTPEHPIPDAVSGATPQGPFVLLTRIPEHLTAFVVMMEINQTWDWNHHWHNNRYPGDEEYQTSCQPALVYRARVDRVEPGAEVELRVVGHSHPSGRTGELFPDVSTFTTALGIAQRVTVSFQPPLP